MIHLNHPSSWLPNFEAAVSSLPFIGLFIRILRCCFSAYFHIPPPQSYVLSEFEIYLALNYQSHWIALSIPISTRWTLHFPYFKNLEDSSYVHHAQIDSTPKIISN